MSNKFRSPCLLSGVININNLYDVNNGGFNIYVNGELIEVSKINFSKHKNLESIAQHISSILGTSCYIDNNRMYFYPTYGTYENYSISLASSPTNPNIYDLSRVLSLTEDTGAIVINGIYLRLNKDNFVYFYPIGDSDGFSDQIDENASLVINTEDNSLDITNELSVPKLSWIETNININKSYRIKLNDYNFDSFIYELFHMMKLGVISNMTINAFDSSIRLTNSYNNKTVKIYKNDVVIKTYHIERSKYNELDSDKYKYLMYYSIPVEEFNSINNPS